jgi:truncated hemoglobin YjbI
MPTEAALVDWTTARIAEGLVIGWFQGRMEWGARALGNRSILADPRRAGMREIINIKIKFREKFRPFAPAILEERHHEYFEGSVADPFMLQVYPVRPDKREVIPAVTHVDGSGRLQTVARAANPCRAHHRALPDDGAPVDREQGRGPGQDHGHRELGGYDGDCARTQAERLLRGPWPGDDIGGAPAVRAVLDAFYPRVLADATLSAFFLGVDIERLKRSQEAFFAMALGGPNAGTERILHAAHVRTRQRGADDAVFDRFVVVFRGVLIDLKVPHGRIHQWLAVLEGARGQILNR